MLLALKENRNGLSAVRRRAKPDTVLVLDDHAISRALVERTLASTGLVCLQLPEGMPALQFIRESRPAVVVMELNTSTEEGFDLLQAARQDLSLAPTRFVVLSVKNDNVNHPRLPYNPLYFRVKDRGGYEFLPTAGAPETSLQAGTLSPGQAVTGQLIFEVPRFTAV